MPTFNDNLLLLFDEGDAGLLRFGPVLNTLVNSGFLMDLVSWGIGSDFPAKDVKIFVLNSLLREFEFLISQAKQQLLYSNGITQPLLKLLDQCPVVSLSLSRLLHTLCVLMCRDPLLLEFTKQVNVYSAHVCFAFLGFSLLNESNWSNVSTVSRDVTRNEYLIFSNLVPLLHLQGPVGNHARDALLLILALSDRDPEVAAYLTSQSDICPVCFPVDETKVLATGLSAHYSCLPKRLVLNGSDGYPSGGDRGRSTETLRVHGAGWHRITKPEWSACEPLVQFLQTLDFCNLAIRKTVDEVTAAEAYLELFLRRLTEPALIGLFLRFIVASDQDSSSVLSSLITRINASSTLGLVTLSLFRTILNLNCEDVMFLVVFQYINGLDFAPKRVVSGCLTSCSGKDNSKYISDPDNDYWLASAQRFLRLSAWCTRFAGAGDTNSQSEDNSTQYPPPNRLATCLLDSHRLIKSRTSSTGVWSADYSVVTSPHPNHTNDPPNAPLHSTPIRTLMTSSLCNKVQTDRQPESSLIDRYKSESNIYQL
ncbi:unnamed protein product, partial [Mesocestoides corti]